MSTDSNSLSDQIQFKGVGKRRVLAAFDAGRTTSDGGVLALRELAVRSRLIATFAACFTDHRNEDLIEHTVEELVGQRIMGIACGYEDLNDHDTLRDDPAFAVAVGKKDPTGEARKRKRDRGHSLAGKSTLNRLELTPAEASAASRYKKITCDQGKVDRFFVDAFLDALTKPPKRIVLDLDTTDDPLHGHQEGRFFHGDYRCYGYLPLYIFCDDHLLCARLRRSNIDGAHGALDELKRIVAQIRTRWRKVKIIVRGDSGFARDEIMAWCEENQVDFVFGLELRYRTRQSWTRERRVIGKAEHISGKANPRFIVTSLRSGKPRALYEKLYCARGDMDNRIKEQQLDLFADRTSTATMQANPLRLYFASVAYVLVSTFRRVALRNTEWARAQCATIRARLLKIGGIVRISARRVYVSLSSTFPLQSLFAQAIAAIQRAYPLAV